MTASRILLLAIWGAFLFQAHSLQLQTSTQEFFHTDQAEHTTCKYRSLLVHEGQVHFLYDDLWPPGVPHMWQHHSWYGKPGPFLAVKRSTLAEARYLIEGQTVLNEAKVSLAWRAWPSNYKISMAESLFMVYNHGCSYFSLCDHASLSSQLAVVFHDKAHVGVPLGWHTVLPAADEAMRCLSKQSWELRSPEWRNLTMLISEAITGIGPHDRAYGDDPTHFDVFTAPSQDLVRGFRNTMATCMGMQYRHPTRRKPLRLTLVSQERPRTSEWRRSMLDAGSLLQHMSDNADYSASALYLEGLSFKQQFEAFSQSDIVVGMHESALGNAMFLPEGSVYIDYNPNLSVARRHDQGMQLLDDLSLNASFIGITPSSEAYAHPVFHAEWNVLKPALALACDIVEKGERRYVVFKGEGGGRVEPSKPLLHRHNDGWKQLEAEFV